MSKKLDYLTDLIRDIYGGRIPENGATLLTLLVTLLAFPRKPYLKMKD